MKGQAGKTVVESSRKIKKSNTGSGVRLYVRATFLGFRTGKSTQNENHALLRIEGVQDRQSTRYYLGKRVCFVFRTPNGFNVIFILIKILFLLLLLD
jgi:ribosomal protein L35AE/L33A